jgi:hypothetical protein
MVGIEDAAMATFTALPEQSSSKIELSPARESQGIGCSLGWCCW